MARPAVSSGTLSTQPAAAARPGTMPVLGILDVIAFLIPLTRFVQFEFIGQLYLVDILLLALLPFLLIRAGRQLFRALPVTAITLLVLWLLAQVATDIVRDSSFHDYSRGWAMIGFTLINFCTLYLLLADKPKRLVLFATGAAIGQIAGYFLAPSIYALDYPWKFGFGDGVNLAMVLLAVVMAKGRGLSRLWPFAILLAVAFLNIILDYRSVGGAAFLASCYLAVQALRRGRAVTTTHVQLRQWIIISGVTLFGVWGSLELYEYSVKAGWLSDAARQKYQMEAAGQYGLIIGGRSEILVSSQAILDSPLLGHGSWAKDCHYESLYIELKRRAGYFPGEEHENCLIPAHSHLFGAWVQAGVLGAVFWIWVLTLPTRVLIRLYLTRERLTALVVYVAFLLAWDIFFSPFGADRRFLTPFYIVMMMSFIPRAAKKSRLVKTMKRLPKEQVLNGPIA